MGSEWCSNWLWLLIRAQAGDSDEVDRFAAQEDLPVRFGPDGTLRLQPKPLIRVVTPLAPCACND